MEISTHSAGSDHPITIINEDSVPLPIEQTPQKRIRKRIKYIKRPVTDVHPFGTTMFAAYKRDEII